MTEERRNELDKLISEYTKEFRESANTDGRFGALYLSSDANKDNVQMSLECDTDLFVRMIVSLMEADYEIAKDIIKSVDYYKSNKPF